MVTTRHPIAILFITAARIQRQAYGSLPPWAVLRAQWHEWHEFVEKQGGWR